MKGNASNISNYVGVWRHLLVMFCHASEPPYLCSKTQNVEMKVAKTEIKIRRKD